MAIDMDLMDRVDTARDEYKLALIEVIVKDLNEHGGYFSFETIYAIGKSLAEDADEFMRAQAINQMIAQQAADFNEDDDAN